MTGPAAAARKRRASPATAGRGRGAAGAFLSRLRLDHARLSRILREIEVQRAQLQGRPESAREVLRDAFRYLLDYQHLFHHPREDLLFDRLAPERPDLGADLRALRKEHGGGLRHAATLGDELARATPARLRGRAGARLARGLQDYVDETREHMRHEERAIFYAGVEPDLPSAAWNALAAAAETPDPLGDPARFARDYPSLAAEIGAPVRPMSAGTRTGAGEPPASAPMRALGEANEWVTAIVETWGELVHDGYAVARANLASVLMAGSPLAAARALPEVGRRTYEFTVHCLVQPAQVTAAYGRRVVQALQPDELEPSQISPRAR